MAANLRRFVKWASWLLPHGFHLARLNWRNSRESVSLSMVSPERLADNVLFSQRHANQRCVILANGPSTKALDLSLLKGEVVISVSNGYLHRSFSEVAPPYHCVPQINYELQKMSDVIVWFQEMHHRLGEAELFLNETEADFIRDHGLFPGRKIHFVAMRESFDEMVERQIIDISAPIPRVQSVPVMAIMIAMYMGFKEVVLLGVDHDHFKDGKYVYAFDLGVQKDKDHSVAIDGQVKTSWYDDFQSLARLWRQYRVLGEIARANGVRIVNATPGGELDEFERVSYRTLFAEAAP